MELKSFRELLLKKAQGNPTLESLLVATQPELFAEQVVEALEKMARPHKSQGRFANPAIVAMANMMPGKTIRMMRDSISHHLTQYKAAYKAGNHKLANEHMRVAYPMLDLLHRMHNNSGGQLQVDAPPMEGREMQHTGAQRNAKGLLVQGTKGYGRRPTKGDYSFVAKTPDPRHKHYTAYPEHRETGAPLHEVQIGDLNELLSGAGYVSINHDAPAPTRFMPHEFDEHPIMKYIDHETKHLTPDHPEWKKFVDGMRGWHDSPASKRWMTRQAEEYAANPAGYMKKGTEQGPHLFEGMDPLPNEPHVQEHLDSMAAASKAPQAISQSGPPLLQRPEELAAEEGIDLSLLSGEDRDNYLSELKQRTPEVPSAPAEPPKIDFSKIDPSLAARAKASIAGQAPPTPPAAPTPPRSAPRPLWLGSFSYGCG